jgi:hypothetical protein
MVGALDGPVGVIGKILLPCSRHPGIRFHDLLEGLSENGSIYPQLIQNERHNAVICLENPFQDMAGFDRLLFFSSGQLLCPLNDILRLDGKIVKIHLFSSFTAISMTKSMPSQVF